MTATRGSWSVVFSKCSRAALSLSILLLASLSASAAVTIGGDAGEITPDNPANWTDTSTVNIGINSGKTATLTIDGGSTVFGRYTYLAYNSGSTATAIVTGTGSIWSIGSSFNVGMDGNATLTIANGGAVNSWNSSIALWSGSSSVTVTGPGSTWTSTTIGVGDGGTGSLRVENGGMVSSIYVGLGTNFNTQGAGTITVTGAGSTLTANDELSVGQNSNSLTVNNGGIVNVGTLEAKMADLKGDGTINAKGAVMDADLVFDGTNQATQTFGSGGTINFNLDGSGKLGAGLHGTGSLSILNGAQVTSTAGYLGYFDGSSGTAVVSGAGSTWTNTGDLKIIANSKLTVTNGGTVSAQNLWATSTNLSGNGTINAKGLVSDVDLTFDASHGLSQKFSFGTAGILNLNYEDGASLGVGYHGASALRIADGVKITSQEGYVGMSSGSGSATVSGSGTLWTLDSLYVGHDAVGKLIVGQGGNINCNNAYIGDGSNSFHASATVIVTGTESRLNAGHTFIIGASSNESSLLKIENGGSLTCGQFQILHAQATVSGKNSSLSAADDISLWDSNASLTVSSGASLTAQSLILSSGSLRLSAARNGVVILGNSSQNGAMSNNHAYFYADAFASAGTYTPIAAYADKFILWNNAGTYTGIGGTWNSNAHTFTVAAASAANSNATVSANAGDRLVISDQQTGKSVGVSFAKAAASFFTGRPLSNAELASLSASLDSEHRVLGSWAFASDGTQKFISFDIGEDASDLAFWQLSSTGWSQFDPTFSNYENGVAGFTDNGLSASAFAVTAVPEPATALLLLAALPALRRIRTRKA